MNSLQPGVITVLKKERVGRKEHDLFLIGTAAARFPDAREKVVILVQHKHSRAAEQANGCITNTQEDISESFATESSSAAPEFKLARRRAFRVKGAELTFFRAAAWEVGCLIDFP